MESTKSHWDYIYSTKNRNEVSWTQDIPKTSLDFIHSFHLTRDASIIDVGGGDSTLVDHLLDEGYEDVTVLDVSAHALARAKERLGERADSVHWVAADITEFTTSKKYDVWHDRAAFHFCLTPEQVEKYLETARSGIKHNGYLTLGTFSTQGPRKCSGLDIRQYSEESLQSQLQEGFEKMRCVTEDHETPFKTLQNFLFCSFRRT